VPSDKFSPVSMPFGSDAGRVESLEPSVDCRIVTSLPQVGGFART
jgi:hypothetical protein